MPELVLKKTGRARFVPDEGLADALASGLYEAPAGDQTVNVTLPGALGLAGQVPLGDIERAQDRGAGLESERSFRGRERETRIEREHGGIGGTVLAGVEAAANEATLGATGALGEAIAGEDYTERRLERAEANPIAAGVGTAAGLIAPAIASGGSSTAAKVLSANPLGMVTRQAARIGKAAEGASLASKVGRTALAGTYEGGATGFGQGVQQLTDSDDPITWERAASVLSSNTLYGAGIGAGVNVAGKLAEKGLQRARKALDEVANKAPTPGAAVSDDLADLDSLAPKERTAKLKAAEAAELDAIKAARQPEQVKFVDDLKAHRQTLSDEKIWLATKDVDAKSVGNVKEIAKINYDADKSIRSMLNNPKNLAENPRRALEALQRQENALEMLSKNADDLRKTFAADTTTARAASLDALPGALDRNRALQSKVREFIAPPSSPRLDEIEALRSGASAGGEKGFGQQLVQGAVFGAATGVASAVPGVDMIPGAAPLIGALAARKVGKGLGSLTKATTVAAQRTAKAVGAFLDVGAKAAPAAPVLASKVLAALAYAPQDKNAERPKTLAGAYKARSAELRTMVAYGPDGTPAMRPEARQRLADNLAPVRVVAPIATDRMETLAARRVEFLASKLPKRPDIAKLPTGPDNWQPSDFEMRSFARYAAAVEDPGAIAERMADGTITPEDAETMRQVYPEMLAELTQHVLTGLPELRATLPYQRRLALSILTGVPVDPAMDPRILRTLQASFVEEPGSEGGTQAPKPQPAFGSVRNQEATASQQRAGAES